MPSGPDRDFTHERRLGTYLREQRQNIPVGVKSLGGYARAADRVGKPITQHEAAAAIGISRTWYALLEEDGANASPALLTRMCRALSFSDEQRFTLFQHAIPELGPIIMSAYSPNLSRYTIPVAFPDHLEETERRLARLREKFFLGELDHADVPRPRILNSWKRCRAANVQPQGNKLAFPPDTTLKDFREANKALLSAADPVMSALTRRLAEPGRVVCLTNADAVIIDVRADADMRRKAYHDPDHPGGDASEAAVGTCTIGTALADGRPIQMIGAEHYSEAWSGYGGSAAPIRSPETDKIVGVLCIGGNHRLVRPHLLGLVVQSALEIEERLDLSHFVA